MDFEEWFKDHRYCDTPLCYGAAKDGFKAGQQSKQAEIDALKEKLKKLEDHIFINYDYDGDDDQHSYWSGYNVAMGEIAAIIEGNKNDT